MVRRSQGLRSQGLKSVSCRHSAVSTVLTAGCQLVLPAANWYCRLPTGAAGWYCRPDPPAGGCGIDSPPASETQTANFKQMDTELILTQDGSHTLYVPDMDEHYHSRFGALTESEHIFINAGLASLPQGDVSVLEVGFGTGLNALLTALHAGRKKIRVSYTTLEKYPLDPSLISMLNYGHLAGEGGEELFRTIHEASWNTPVPITEWFILEKRQTDLTAENPSGVYDLVYFDAFGPDKQPEMWSEKVLNRIAVVTHPGSLFVTYSAKGNLKRMLRSLGFEVEHLPGPPGKRVFTRAVKI